MFFFFFQIISLNTKLALKNKGLDWQMICTNQTSIRLFILCKGLLFRGSCTNQTSLYSLASLYISMSLFICNITYEWILPTVLSSYDSSFHETYHEFSKFTKFKWWFFFSTYLSLRRRSSSLLFHLLYFVVLELF